MHRALSAPDFVFLDVAGALLDRDPNGHTARGSTKPIGLLEALRNLGMRVGIITTLGRAMSNDEALRLLRIIGIEHFIYPNGFVSDHDAGTAKFDSKTYVFAAAKVGVPVERCLFVSDHLIEVNAARVAGMQAILRPPNGLRHSFQAWFSHATAEQTSRASKIEHGCVAHLSSYDDDQLERGPIQAEHESGIGQDSVHMITYREFALSEWKGMERVMANISVEFTNKTPLIVGFFLNGGTGLKTNLGPGATQSFSMVVDPGVQPIVGIFQSTGERLDFSVSDGGQYAFNFKDGNIENFFA